MIKSFKHKGLEKFYLTGNTRGIQAKHAGKLRMQLAALDTAQTVNDLDLPGYKLHPLRGAKQQTWSIKVNANWRLTFAFIQGHVYLLNYEDYH